MADEDEPTKLEIEVMHHILNAATLGLKTAKEAHESKRLLEKFGYVAKDGSGHLALTPRGEKFLKSRENGK
jgi:hypothetical protein